MSSQQQSYGPGLSGDEHTPKERPKIDAKVVDALLAQELTGLSLAERETVFEEVHGVKKKVEETPEFLEVALAEMENAIQNIPDKQAYEEATEDVGTTGTDATATPYLDTRKVRLLFLRTEKYDSVKAAARLVKYAEGMKRYFGLHVLKRPVMLCDLDADDKATLKSGVMQILPARDRVGRAVAVDFLGVMDKCYRHPRNLVRKNACNCSH